MIFIDLETGGFYNNKIHSEVPKTAKEITRSAYEFFLEHNGQYKLNVEKAIKIDIITEDTFDKIEYVAQPMPTTIEERQEALELAFMEMAGEFYG